MNGHNEFNDHEWSREERAQLQSLPEERIPPARLKERTIDALTTRGLIQSRRATQARWLALAAAASLVFAAGALVGYAFAQRSAQAAIEARTTATRHDVARAPTDTATTQQVRHVVWY